MISYILYLLFIDYARNIAIFCLGPFLQIHFISRILYMTFNLDQNFPSEAIYNFKNQDVSFLFQGTFVDDGERDNFRR